MITVNVQFKCDSCGKIQEVKESFKDYEECTDSYVLYIPNGWSWFSKDNDIACEECTQEKFKNDDGVWMA